MTDSDGEFFSPRQDMSPFKRRRLHRIDDPEETPSDGFTSASEQPPASKSFGLRRTPRTPKPPPRGNRYKELCRRRSLGNKADDVVELSSDGSSEADLAERSEEEQAGTSDSLEDDFIVEDAEELEGDVRKLLGRELGIFNLGDIEDMFPKYITHLAGMLRPGYESGDEADEDPELKAVCSTIERRLADMRDRSVKSQSWNDAAEGFIPALVSRPYSKIRSLTRESCACAACKKPRAYASQVLVFYGDPYEPNWGEGKPLKEAADQGAGRAVWLQDAGCTEFDYQDFRDEFEASGDESDDAPGQSFKPRSQKEHEAFAVGKWCGARVRLFHSFLHFKGQLQQLVSDRLEEIFADLRHNCTSDFEEGYSSSDFDTAVKMLGRDREFVREQLEHYQTLMRLAEKYLSGSEAGNRNSYRDDGDRLINQIHVTLDDIAPRTARRNRRLEIDQRGQVRLADSAVASALKLAEAVRQADGSSQDVGETQDTDDLPLREWTIRRLARRQAERPTRRRLWQSKLSSYPKAPRFSDDADGNAGPLSSDVPDEAISPRRGSDTSNQAEPDRALPARDDSGAPAANLAEGRTSDSNPQTEAGTHEASEPSLVPSSPKAASDVHRTFVQLGSALNEYHRMQRHAAEGGLSTERSMAARQRALRLVADLQIEFGAQQVPLRRSACMAGVAEIYLELAQELGSLAVSSGIYQIEARERSILLLEDIRARL